MQIAEKGCVRARKKRKKGKRFLLSFVANLLAKTRKDFFAMNDR